MISISDDTTVVILQEDATLTDWGEWSPRIQRTATLDGGSVLSNYGMSHGDREFRIGFEASEATVRALEAMIEGGEMLYLGCVEGYFSGMISRFLPGNGHAEMTFTVNEKLA